MAFGTGKSGGVRPTDAAAWSGGRTGSRSTGAGSGDADRRESGHGGAPDPRTDRASFSALLHLSRQGDASGDPLEALLQMIVRGGEHIQALALNRRPQRAEQKSVPSTLGLELHEAAGKLRLAGLGVIGVTREYSADVPPGRVTAQLPGPGSRVAWGEGVRLTVSGGAPPATTGTQKSGGQS